MSTAEISVPGVDLDDARRRLVDDIPFLLSLLREFVRHSIALERSLNLGGSPSSVEDDLRKLHQIRGGAGNLAVRTVEGVSARLELSLKQYLGPNHPDAATRKVLKDLRSRLQGELFALRDALHDASVGIIADEDLISPRSTPPAARQIQSSGGRRILVIDDSTAMRSYLRATLEKHDPSLEVIEASDGLSGFQRLTEGRPDLVLCDLQMPKFDGLKLLSMWASRPELREIPVLMLTAEHDAERKAKLLAQGAADYITKPFHGGELVARVAIHLGVRKLREENRQLRALLDDQKSSDPHTGVFNRRYFETTLLDEVQRTTRYAVPLSLIIMQLQRFERGTERDGYVSQDKLLSSVGPFLNDAIRTTDKAARIAQDKFAIILTHTGASGAQEMASRLCRSFHSSSSNGAMAPQHRPMAAMGVASSEGTPITARDLLERAESALAESIKRGGGRVVSWAPSLPDSSHANMR